MRIIYTIVKPSKDIDRLVRKKLIQSINYMGHQFVARYSVNKGNLMKIAKKNKSIGRI